MKVAMVTSWGVRCGIYTYTRNLVNALAKLDAEVYIIRLPRFGKKDPDILQNVVDSIPVDKVDLIACQHEYGLYQGLEGSFYSGLKKLGKPIVTTMHATGNWDIDGVIVKSSNHVIVHNEFCARRLGYPSIIIQHGCQTVKCPPIERCKRNLGIPVHAKMVGYCGFISSYKGLETLIEAMAEVPNAGLLIAGGYFTEAETQYMIELQQTAAKLLPNRCQWLGYIPDERLASTYGAMDMVVYPSRFISESGALLTALGHGKAVLASPLPPVIEKEKQGALRTFKDGGDMAVKIKRILSDGRLKRRLEEGAMSYSYKYSWASIARKHLKLYRETVSTVRLLSIHKALLTSTP